MLPDSVPSDTQLGSGPIQGSIAVEHLNDPRRRDLRETQVRVVPPWPVVPNRVVADLVLCDADLDSDLMQRPRPIRQRKHPVADHRYRIHDHRYRPKAALG